MIGNALSAVLMAVAAVGAEQAADPAGEAEVRVTRHGQQVSRTGPPEFFTGTVRIDPLFDLSDPSRATSAAVTFEPGARTVWHSHALGQHLIVTAGTGRVQRWGDPIQEIRTGDVVWIPAGQKHWHGASPATAMTHIAIQESAGDKSVAWMEPVTDEQYGGPVTPAPDPIAAVPALEKYKQDVLLGDLWKRPGLSLRDRSVVTVAALVARGQTVEMPYYFGLALDSGVRPAELAEILTHLAFYTGWANATAGAAIAGDVFASRNIGADQLPAETAQHLPLDEAAEKLRAAHVAQEYGQVAPGLVQYTTDVLFRDLWLRPALAPRDRSLVTVSALIATGQVAQVPFHLGKALDNGLTKTEASEVLTQLAFYAGWPSAFSALPVVKATLEKRP